MVPTPPPTTPNPHTFIRDAKTHWAANAVPSAAGPYVITTQEDLARMIYEPMAQRRGIALKPPTPENRDTGDPLPVMVSANRWVVMCPDCGGAEFAWPDHFWFMCASCFNVSRDGNWRPVVWPGDDDLAAVEEVLQARPDPLARNWQPDREDIADLEAQNREHGAPERLPDAGRQPRLTGARTARDRRGDTWRQHVRKAPPMRGAMPVPTGWSQMPATSELPEETPVGDTILYPDVPPPVTPLPPEWIPSEESDDGVL